MIKILPFMIMVLLANCQSDPKLPKSDYAVDRQRCTDDYYAGRATQACVRALNGSEDDLKNCKADFDCINQLLKKQAGHSDPTKKGEP
jgi:hypothetical protein